MDRFLITVVRNGTEQTIEGKAGESLLAALSGHNIYLSATCGNGGRCGKCGVQMVSGVTEIREADRKFFHGEQLERGMHLACEAYPQGDCRILIETGDERDFEIVSDYRTADSDSAKDGRTDTEETGYDIAIDLGTTTIAACLIGCDSGNIRHTVTRINHQRAYGADVISRIQAANDGKLKELSCCIRSDLYQSMLSLLSASHTDFSRIRRVAIAGNTTMGHLLMGYSCETLGVYPFEPVNIETTEIRFEELFGFASAESEKTEGIPCYAGEPVSVILLPGISAYVGADIAAGLLTCGFDRSDEINVLIDLGTNGEMAVGNREKILTASTAAGAAFEEGNISCGMGSVGGAICRVEISGADVTCGTIGEKEPLGLCGTGVIECVYELLKEEWIDETGALNEDYFDDGFPLAKTPDGASVSLNQKDVREIQLAKSAVRSGLETLLLRYGISYKNAAHVYLAGGFGHRMNLAKAAWIGLLPAELMEQTEAAGNTSLGGTIAYLTDKEAAGRLEKIIGITEEIPLASDRDFNRFYTEYMFFE